MKMAELLRQLADQLDGMEGPNGSNNAVPNEPESDAEEQPVMMAPNQQKLELLKKGVGVESEFDKQDSDKELNAIKKNAGISPAVVHIASDDDPLE